MNLCVFVFVVSTTVANAVLNNGFLSQRSGLNNQKRESEDSTLYYDPKSPEPIDEASSFIQVGSAMYNRATLHRTSLTLEMKVEQSKAERKFREMSEESKKELERKSLARALTARKKYDEAMSSLQVVKMQRFTAVAADVAEFLQATDKYQQSVQDAPKGEDAPNKEDATLGMDNEALQKLAQMHLDKVTKLFEEPNAAKMSLIDSSRLNKMLEDLSATKMLLIESTKVEKARLALDDLREEVASPTVDQRKASSALSL